jgi:hypothetical protein
MSEFSLQCPAKLTLVGRSDHAAAARSSLSEPRNNHQVSIRQWHRRQVADIVVLPYRHRCPKRGPPRLSDAVEITGLPIRAPLNPARL